MLISWDGIGKLYTMGKSDISVRQIIQMPKALSGI